MRYFILLLIFFTTPVLITDTLLAQTKWETVSKSCTNCNKKVSINSKVGMKCPHCHVIWGSEITRYDKKKKKNITKNSSIKTKKKQITTYPSTKTNYTYRRCNAVAKSTGKRCKRGVSASTHYQCYQHR